MMGTRTKPQLLHKLIKRFRAEQHTLLLFVSHNLSITNNLQEIYKKMPELLNTNSTRACLKNAMQHKMNNNKETKKNFTQSVKNTR
jgi:phosphohistidine phosphatase SixA